MSVSIITFRFAINVALITFTLLFISVSFSGPLITVSWADTVLDCKRDIFTIGTLY